MTEDPYGNLVSSLAKENDESIVLLVMDGVGDCDNDGNGTALQQAETPNLDALSKESALGLHIPVAQAITPGAVPGTSGSSGMTRSCTRSAAGC